MRNRIIKILLSIFILVFIGIQFMKPSVRQNETGGHGNNLYKLYNVPPAVQAILRKSCDDCHSNTTDYPWYTSIQPVRYYLGGHVKAAKEELNFDEFASYSKRKRSNKLRAIVSSIKEQRMPLPSYLLMHHQARLSQQEAVALINWIKTVDDTI